MTRSTTRSGLLMDRTSSWEHIRTKHQSNFWSKFILHALPLLGFSSILLVKDPLCHIAMQLSFILELFSKFLLFRDSAHTSRMMWQSYWLIFICVSLIQTLESLQGYMIQFLIWVYSCCELWYCLALILFEVRWTSIIQRSPIALFIRK